MTQLVLTKDVMNMNDEVLFKTGTRVDLVSCEGDFLIASHKNSDGEETTFPLKKGEFELRVEHWEMQLKNVYASEDIADSVITLGISRVGRSLKDEPEKLAKLIGEVMNSFGNPAEFGLQVGQEMHTEHRTLQRLVIIWAFNLLKGISHQEYTDPRNEDAIVAAKKLAEMMDEFDTMEGSPTFNFGAFI